MSKRADLTQKILKAIEENMPATEEQAEIKSEKLERAFRACIAAAYECARADNVPPQTIVLLAAKYAATRVAKDPSLQNTTPATQPTKTLN